MLRLVRDGLRPSTATGGAQALPLLVLAGITFFDQFDKAAFAALTPEIEDFFGLDLAGVSLLITLASIVTIVLTVPAGFAADRWRRTWISGVGALSLAAFAILSGTAPAFLLFGVARAGASLNKTTDAVQYSLLSDSYPPGVRPGVFSFRQMAYEAGAAIGPLVAGAVAAVTLWQFTFVIEAIPLLILAWLAFRVMREPARGEQDRLVQGLDEAGAEDSPPSLAESVRIAWSVRSLRRIIYSLPFLVGAGLGIATLSSVYYDDVFNVGPGLRGVFLALPQPAAFAGLIVGGSLANGFLRDRPARVIAYAGAMAVFAAMVLVGIAVAPVVWIAVFLSCLLMFAVTILGPALMSLLSLVLPARARGFGLSLGAVAVIPGYIFFYLASTIGDHFGIRIAMLALAPVLAVGAIILGSGASGVAADIRAATAATTALRISRDSESAGGRKLLVVHDLDVSYGPVQVLFNVDFEVSEGEVIALLGTNGAGKSTLLRAISGLTDPANGAIVFDGEDITHLPAHEHQSRGIVSMPGGKATFPSLTVEENLRLAQLSGDADGASLDEVLDTFPELRTHLGKAAGSLSGGEQQMIGLGQALLSRPRVLMVDELSLGLAPAVVARLIEVVKKMNEQGTTVILVEQSVNVALTVAGRAVFMEKGEIRFTGPTAELLERGDILRSVYVRGTGRSRTLVNVLEPPLDGVDDTGPVLEVKGLSKAFGGVTAVDGVSFSLEAGQILGFIGPNGAGKTSVFDLISGFTTPDAGQVMLLGQDVTYQTPDQRAAHGLLRSFQDGRLFPALTVAENLAVALDMSLANRSASLAALHVPIVSRAEARVNQRVDRLVDIFSLGGLRSKFIRELSTGQRRLVDMACALAAGPKVLLLDEPSSGIAQREAEELGPLLRRIQQETGAAMLVIEHDMPLLLSVAPRFIAMEQGVVVTEGPASEVLEHPRVVAAYLGSNEDAINRSTRS